MSVLVTSKASDLLDPSVAAVAPRPAMRISSVQLPPLGISHSRSTSTSEVEAGLSVPKEAPQACEEAPWTMKLEEDASETTVRRRGERSGERERRTGSR